MPTFFLTFFGAFLTFVGSLVGRVMVALGIGYAAYSGLTTLMTSLKSQVVSQFAGLPSTAIGILAVTKVDVGISIFFSAIAARLVLNGLTSDVIKKMVV